MEYRIKNQKEFNELIDKVGEGDIVYLKPGEYIWNPSTPQFNPPFTIQSESGNNSNTILLATPNVKNLLNGMSFIGMSVNQIPFPKDYYVKNSEELFEALKKVTSLDKIILAPGGYSWGQTQPVHLPTFSLIGESGKTEDVTLWVSTYGMQALLEGQKIVGINVVISF